MCANPLSGWIDVYGAPSAGAKGLVACLRSLFCAKGVPVELSSDGGPEFTAGKTRAFLERWGVCHRLSSAYHPQSNGRAEAAVKSAKRMMRDNTRPNGDLDHDKIVRAFLAHRNTPTDSTGLSPAHIIFGRQLPADLNKFSDDRVHPAWRETWRLREAANRQRFYCQQQRPRHRSFAT